MVACRPEGVASLFSGRVRVTLTIAKNADHKLSASHVVDVLVSAPLRDSAIRRLLSLVAKASEHARGEPLAGATAATSDEPFRIELADEPERAAANVRLLQQATWFDLVIAFEDGEVGILTLEKGAAGETVFNEVLRQWPAHGPAFPKGSWTPPLCASGVAVIRSGEKVARYPGAKRELGGEIILEFTGIDFPGADYESLAGIPLVNCVVICRFNVNCLAYTYNTRASHCFLKNRWTEARAHADAHSGLKCSRAP